MRGMKLAGAATAALAMVAMAVPAEAQRHRGRHHHRDRVDGGDVVLGALLAGGLIALVSSAKKRERARAEAEADAYEEPMEAEPYVPETGAEVSDYSDIRDADQAADTCAAAAEAEGQRLARIARVGAIEAVDAAGTSWRVRGKIELRNDYRTRGNERPFSCTIAGPGMPSVRIEGEGAQ